MKIGRIGLTATALGVCLLASEDGAAKARSIYAELYEVEAVVTHVDTSDNPGDTDMNVLLRPVSVDQAGLFWDRFWPYMDQEWIDDVLADVTAKMPQSSYGETCRACAGTGPTGTACKITEGASYSHHPCPRLYACNACLNDIERVTGIERANLTVKAEIFVNDPGSPWNDDNATFRRMKDDLGFPRFTCDEGDQATVCGRRVWVSGWVATDNSHDNRPELHPVSAFVVDRGTTGNGTRKVRMGSFIDGSTDASFQWVPWMANYHDLVPMARHWRFDTSSGPFKLLYPPKPGPTAKPLTEIVTASSSELKSHTLGFALEAACAGPLRAQIAKLEDQLDAIDAQVAELQKERDHIGPGNQGGGDKPTIAKEIKELMAQRKPLAESRSQLLQKLAQCPASRYRTIDVNMDFDAIAGSYWVGSATLGWEVPSAFGLSVTRVGSRAGYLAKSPPSSSNLPPAPPARQAPAGGGLQAFTQISQCIVPEGTSGPGLKRWFGWKVKVDSTFYNKVAALTWQVPPGAVWKAGPPSQVQTGSTEVELWVPAPAYAGEVKATAKVSDGTTAWDAEELANAAPTASIAVKDGSVQVGATERVYSANVSAAAFNLCGPAGGYTWTWTKDGAPMPGWSGAGPHAISLKSGEKTKLEVVVRDSFGAEKALDAVVVVAPELSLDTSLSCLDSAKIELPTPRPFTPPSGAAPATLCKQTKVSATALAVSGDQAFNETSVGRATFKWNDLEIATEDDGWKWRAVPATWKVTYPEARSGNRAVVIAPDKTVHFMLKASVTVTDPYGRTATAHVTGDNDFTPLPELAAIVRRYWATWRPSAPLPAPALASAPIDPVARRVAATLAFLARTKATNARGVESARRAVRALRLFGFDVVSTERGASYKKPLRPTFTVPRTRTTRIGPLTGAARKDLLQRTP